MPASASLRPPDIVIHDYESPTESTYNFFGTPPGSSGGIRPASPSNHPYHPHHQHHQHQHHAHPNPRSSSHPGFALDPVARRPTFTRHASYVPRGASTGTAPDGNEGPFSLDDVLEKGLPPKKVSILDRIKCYQWTYFTMTMATGGIANVLHSIPYRSDWLNGVGIAFFLFNIFLFTLNCVLITIRFRLCPGSFTHSFTDQVESLFIPSFFVSMATIFINICEYGIPETGPWLLRTMEIMFWIYVALSTFASAGMYLVLWSTLVFPVHMMTPTWVFPAYPLLLTAPFAANLINGSVASGSTSSLHTTSVALCAVTTQGTGCLIAFMISAAFMYRLMTQKLPRDLQRPGVFISIGPFGFTVAGIVQLGSQADLIIPDRFLGSEGTATTIGVVRVMSLLVGLWLWGLSMWFFLVSVGSLWKYVRPDRDSRIPFQMNWWSFVFPNTALVTATESLGKVLESDGLQIYGCVMAGLLILVWVAVFTTMMDCLRRRKILWPKDAA